MVRDRLESIPVPSGPPSGPKSLPSRPQLLADLEAFLPGVVTGPSRRHVRRYGMSRAEAFLASWPDPSDILRLPVAEGVRQIRSDRFLIYFATFLIWQDYLRPSYEFLAHLHSPVLHRTFAELMPDDFARVWDWSTSMGYREYNLLRIRRSFVHLCAHSGARALAEIGADDVEDMLAASRARLARQYLMEARELQRCLEQLGVPPASQVVRTGRPPVRMFGAAGFAQIRAERIGAVMLRYLDQVAGRLRPGTISSYAGTLLHFAEFLQVRFPDVTSLADVRRQPHVTAWLQEGRDFVSTIRPHAGLPAHNTWSAMIIRLGKVLRDIAAWEWEDGPTRPLLDRGDAPPLQQLLPFALGDDEAARLMQAARKTDSLLGRLAVTFLLATGLRIGEFALLETESFYKVRDPDSGRLVTMVRVPAVKMYRERSVPLLSQDALEAKAAWDAHRPPVRAIPHPQDRGRLANFWLMGGRGYGVLGIPITADLIRKAIKQVASEAGLDPSRTWPHRLRHTLATQLINQPQVREGTVSRLLGHQIGSPMTARYAVLQDRALLAEMKGLHELLDARLGRSEAAAAAPEEPTRLRALRHDAARLWRDQGYCYCSRDANTYCVAEESCLRCGLAVYTAEHLPVLERMAVSAEAAGQVRRLNLILAAVEKAKAAGGAGKP